MNIKKFHHKTHNLVQLLLMTFQPLEILFLIFVYKFKLVLLNVLKLHYQHYQLIDLTQLGNNLFLNQVINQWILLHLLIK